MPDSAARRWRPEVIAGESVALRCACGALVLTPAGAWQHEQDAHGDVTPFAGPRNIGGNTANATASPYRHDGGRR